MGDKYDAPDPPDYRGAAEEQARASQEIATQTTWANRPNQYTPWGASEWDATAGVDPATGQPITNWQQTISLSPQQQRALDYQFLLGANRSELASGLYDRLAQSYAEPFDASQFNEWSTGPTPVDASTLPGYGQTPENFGPIALQESLSTEGLTELNPAQRYFGEAEDAIYGQWARRAEPRLENQMTAMDTQLRNQGLTPGTEAYDFAMSQLRQSQEDARQGAQYQATIGAGQEAQRMLGMDASTRAQLFGERGAQGDFANRAAMARYGMMGDEFSRGMGLAEMGDRRRGQEFGIQSGIYGQGMQSAGFGNSVRQAQMAEALLMRGLPLNEVNAILTGTQVAQPQMPTFNQATVPQTPQYMAAAQNQYGANLDRFNSQQAGMQGMMSGLVGLGTLPFMPWM